jgi:hypothetical protein
VWTAATGSARQDGAYLPILDGVSLFLTHMQPDYCRLHRARLNLRGLTNLQPTNLLVHQTV